MGNRASAVGENGGPKRRERLYDLDWLRVFAILLVFLVHCSKIFDYHTAIVANPVRSPVLTAFRDFILLWIMPLFFVLSGASVFLSEGADKVGVFIKSRFLRLFVPLVFVGTFLINPIYVYIERLSGGQAAGGFFQWYPQYFHGMYGFGGNFAPLGHGTHLWYLEFLFIYSLLLLPLFVRSKKRGAGFLARFSVYFENPWALFFLFLPVSAISAAFETAGLGGARVMGAWDPLSYLLFFSYGYLIFSNSKIRETMTRFGPICTAAAVVLTALSLDAHFGWIARIPGLTRHDLLNDGALLPLDPALWTVFQAMRGLIAWCWIIGLLGLGSRFLNFNKPLLAYANEAVLPFYILHHSVIYIVGFYVIPSSSGVAAKFSMIAFASFIVIMAVYEIGIRRINWFRWLFGMKTG